MKVSYFAWMRRTVGVSDEEVSPPPEVRTVGDLVFWLRSGAPHVALVDQVDANGQVWITEAANPSAGVRRRAMGGSWDDTYLSGFGRVIRST